MARSVLCLSSSASTTTGSNNSTLIERTHAEPLSDTAVSALFGSGDEARRRLIEGWLEEGLRRMENRTSVKGMVEKVNVRDALHARLEYNEPVLGHLPEVRLQWILYSLTRIDVVNNVGFCSPHLAFFRHTTFRSLSGIQTRRICRR